MLLLCERGERAALREYFTALHSRLPAGVLELVERQHTQLKEAYKRLYQIREQMQNDESVGDAPNSRKVGVGWKG